MDEVLLKEFFLNPI